jgi:hypothetical protein
MNVLGETSNVSIVSNPEYGVQRECSHGSIPEVLNPIQKFTAKHMIEEFNQSLAFFHNISVNNQSSPIFLVTHYPVTPGTFTRERYARTQGMIPEYLSTIENSSTTDLDGFFVSHPNIR